MNCIGEEVATVSGKCFARIAYRPLGCLVLAGLAFASTPAFAQSSNEGAEGFDIIVTAQKREEKLQDVPIPITAVTGDALLAQNLTRAQDFFSSVPGVSLQMQSGKARVAIRGITTGPGAGNPTTGITVDDVPYGSSVDQGGFFGAVPDLDPSDLARIEVLRGPQGTLYGASSIGGLLKYVTIDPKTDKFEGSVGGGLSMPAHSNTLGYNVRGMVNVPVSDAFAIRASAYHRKEPGYIDNIRTGKKDVNSADVTGGRVSALWKPSDSFSLKLGAMYQKRDLNGSHLVDTTTGSIYQQTDQIGAGRSSSENQIYSAVATADLGGVEFTSVSAYSSSSNYDYLDFTAVGLTAFLLPPLYYPATEFGLILYQTYGVDKFSQEMRFAGGVGQNIDWIAGGFYTHESSKYTIDASGINPDTGAIYGTPIIWKDSQKFDEWAVFGNATLRLSEQFDVQFGGRYSENKQKLHHTERNMFPVFGDDGAPVLGASQPVNSDTNPRASGHSFTYQVSPRFKPSPDHMIYGRLATGYRPGATNANCDTPISTTEVPCSYRPDKIINYELGAKGDLLGRALSYDVSAFLIDWKDLQITQVIGADGLTYTGNAGKARSKGIELSLEARPVQGLSVTAWGAYTDAAVSSSYTSGSITVSKGDRLPYSAKWSGRFSFDYETPLTDTVTLNFGAALTYVGNRQGEIPTALGEGADPRQVYPEYTTLDLNAGLDVNKLRFSLFVQNVTNKYGMIGGGTYNAQSYNSKWFNFLPPRTIGMNVALDF